MQPPGLPQHQLYTWYKDIHIEKHSCTENKNFKGYKGNESTLHKWQYSITHPASENMWWPISKCRLSPPNKNVMQSRTVRRMSFERLRPCSQNATSKGLTLRKCEGVRRTVLKEFTLPFTSARPTGFSQGNWAVQSHPPKQVGEEEII